jgi:hypothetical protein
LAGCEPAGQFLWGREAGQPAQAPSRPNSHCLLVTCSIPSEAKKSLHIPQTGKQLKGIRDHPGPQCPQAGPGRHPASRVLSLQRTTTVPFVLLLLQGWQLFSLDTPWCEILRGKEHGAKQVWRGHEDTWECRGQP